MHEEPTHQTPPTRPLKAQKRTTFTFSSAKEQQSDNKGELISQATNESCSEGVDEDDEKEQEIGSPSPTTPYESYAH